MADDKKSFREIRQETKLLHDPAAVREQARRRCVYLGSQPTKRLRKYGVGVPLLWPTTPTHGLRFAPLGMQVFHALTYPPMSWLWAAATTEERIVASLHIEFVDDIARVCEAVDIQPDGVGTSYVLSAEPVNLAISRCLDTVGFAETGGTGVRTRFRACFPFRWDGHHVTRVPNEQMRSLIVRFAPTPGTTPTVEEQIRSDCDDVSAVPGAPSRAGLEKVLTEFFTARRAD